MRSNLIVEVTTRADMRTVNTGCTDREINGESECAHHTHTHTHVQTSRLRSYAEMIGT